jgi:hypothetical protein
LRGRPPLVAVGVAGVVAAVAVPVMVAAATPSPTVTPAVTARPVPVAQPGDDHGGRREIEPACAATPGETRPQPRRNSTTTGARTSSGTPCHSPGRRR